MADGYWYHGDGKLGGEFYPNKPNDEVHYGKYVPVVRCRDCRHKFYDGNQIICQKLYWCDGNNFEPTADDFCSRGERKEVNK